MRPTLESSLYVMPNKFFIEAQSEKISEKCLKRFYLQNKIFPVPS